MILNGWLARTEIRLLMLQGDITLNFLNCDAKLSKKNDIRKYFDIH